MLKRNPNDSRLPAITQGDWKAGKRSIFRYDNGVGANTMHPGVARNPRFRKLIPQDGDLAVMSAAPGLLACIFGLLVNFPELGNSEGPRVGLAKENLADSVLDWLDDQAPAWRAALEKAGVELDRKP